jgi:hypothetical protein
VGVGVRPSVRREKVLVFRGIDVTLQMCHPPTLVFRPVIIAVSALLELVEWIESRRKSCQGGVPCNAPLGRQVSGVLKSNRYSPPRIHLIQSSRCI